jgi:hypothetical protein
MPPKRKRPGYYKEKNERRAMGRHDKLGTWLEEMLGNVQEPPAHEQPPAQAPTVPTSTDSRNCKSTPAPVTPAPHRPEHSMGEQTPCCLQLRESVLGPMSETNSQTGVLSPTPPPPQSLEWGDADMEPNGEFCWMLNFTETPAITRMLETNSQLGVLSPTPPRPQALPVPQLLGPEWGDADKRICELEAELSLLKITIEEKDRDIDRINAKYEMPFR